VLQARAAGNSDSTRLQDTRDPKSAASGYSVVQVRTAALEAGIDSEYVEAALAEVGQARALAGIEQSSGVARLILGDPPSVLTAKRTIEASAEAVLEAMQDVVQGEPFRLALTDRRGDPLNGGTLVFDVPGMKSVMERGFAFDTSDSGVKQIFVSLRALAGDRCEITVRGHVTAQKVGTGVGTLAGTLGAGVLGAAGLASGLGIPAIIGGALLGGGVGLKGFRTLYHGAMRRSEGALDRLAGAVGARATGGIRGLAPPSAAEPETGDPSQG